MSRQSKIAQKEPLVPERIREARLARGMSAIDLASAIGVSRQAISKYELGSAEPSFAVLEALSNTLRMPISFLSKPPEAGANRGTTFYRSLKTNAARAKDIMATKSEWASEIASFVERGIVFPDVDIPSLPEEFNNAEAFSDEEIEDIAEYVRRCWKLGNGPIPNISRTLEAHGVVISTIKTGCEETDACSCFIDSRPFIFLDTQKECAVRTRFNLSHELGHLILHGGISQSDIADKKEQDRIEKEANHFASCFLLPRESFLRDIRSTSLTSFLPLKKKWKVSIQAMVYRCKELGVFSDSQMIYIQKQISARRWRKNEPFDDEWPCEEPIVLRTAVNMLVDRGDFSKEDFSSILRFPALDIEEICSLPEGFLSEREQDMPIIIDFATKRQI